MSQHNSNNLGPAQNNAENQSEHRFENEVRNVDGNHAENNGRRNNAANAARNIILNEARQHAAFEARNDEANEIRNRIVHFGTLNQRANAARNQRGYEIVISNERQARNNQENDGRNNHANDAGFNQGRNAHGNNPHRLQRVPTMHYYQRIPIFYAANSTMRRYVIHHNGHLDNFYVVLQPWSLPEALRAISIESHIKDTKQFYALTNPTFQTKPIKCCDMVNETDEEMTEYENTSFWHNNNIYKVKMMHIAKSNKVDSTTDPFDYDCRTIYMENLDFQSLFALPRHFPRFYRMFHGPCQISYTHPRLTFYVYIEFISSSDAFDAMYYCLRHFGDLYVRFKRFQTRNLYEHWGCTRVVYSLLEDYRPIPSGLIGRKLDALTDDEKIRRSNWIVNPNILIEAFNHF